MSAKSLCVILPEESMSTAWNACVRSFFSCSVTASRLFSIICAALSLWARLPLASSAMTSRIDQVDAAWPSARVWSASNAGAPRLCATTSSKLASGDAPNSATGFTKRVLPAPTSASNAIPEGGALRQAMPAHHPPHQLCVHRTESSSSFLPLDLDLDHFDDVSSRRWHHAVATPSLGSQLATSGPGRNPKP